MYKPLATIALAVLAACGDNNAQSPDASVSHPDGSAAVDAGVDTPSGVDFTETYESGSQDVGNWILSDEPTRPRMINATGGDPGSYLYSEVSTSIPTWSTASTRYQPGVFDASKRNSVFVGDYYTASINKLSVDLEVIQPGSWTEDRTVTLHLMSWDTANNKLAVDATYSLPDIPDVPVGWQHYDFMIDSQSPTIPTGWVLMRGDGTPGTDADWATLMHQIDLVGFGYWKPFFGYPASGLWQLGIDNIRITSQP